MSDLSRDGYTPPRRIIPLLIVSILVGAAAFVAAVIGAQSSVARREDVVQNRRILDHVCEDANRITEALTSSSPDPCPTDE